jgi:hypothetical protein
MDFLLSKTFDCVVCFEKIDTIDNTNCCKSERKHFLCNKCYEDWKKYCTNLRRNFTCPICRGVICPFMENIDEDSDEDSDIIVQQINDNYVFNPNNMHVYDINNIDDENGVSPVGILTEVREIYSQIEFEDKYYSICKEVDDNGRTLLFCIFTERLFDSITKGYVGKLKNENNEYYIEYS